MMEAFPPSPPRKPVLLLRLEGPLQSWGVRSRWDVRDTQPEPTKSGVIGLLGCALGLERGSARLGELHAQLLMGVRVEAPGRVITDYQTITGFLPTAAGEWKGRGSRKKSVSDLKSDPESEPATIISPRSYLEDAAFLVALEAKNADGELLRECARALHNPVWTLFLGRKTCVPTCPIFETLTEEYTGAEEALRHHPWQWLGALHQSRAVTQEQLSRTQLRTLIEDPAGPRTVQDAAPVGAARVYGFRTVRPGWVPLSAVCASQLDNPQELP